MKQFAYVGCRTTKERNARGKGIRIFEIENGTWKPVGLLEGPVNPSYFCLNEAQDMLYTIHGDYRSQRLSNPAGWKTCLLQYSGHTRNESGASGA